MTDIKWTPVKDVAAWGEDFVYHAGVEYTGLPYGQPVYTSYVPWYTSLEGFISAVKDPDSKMYTARSQYLASAPYYSVDCSAFVSWAWNLPERKTTVSILQSATLISDSSYEDAEVGDCICRSTTDRHVVLITDIQRDLFGKIVSVEISEATVNEATHYCCQKVRYGSGGAYTLSYFREKYFGSGFILYRSKTRDNVSYTHSCVSPIEGDECEKCGFGWNPCEHDFVSSVFKQTSCSASGELQFKCSLCSKTYYEPIPMLPHDYGDWDTVKEPTCIAEGIQQRVCLVCSAADTRTVPISYDHAWTVESETEPSCTKEGFRELCCSLCLKRQSERLPKTAHRFVNGKCSVCGEPKNRIKGDVNCDGVISSADAVMLARHLAGIVLLEPGNQTNADMNGDGVISSADAVLLAQRLVN